MYLDFFSLREEPFSMTPDPGFFFLSHQHEVALEGILYGITQGKGFMVLTGEVGTGKSTLCRAVLDRLKSQVDFSLIINPLLSVQGLLTAINRDFGIGTDATTVEKAVEDLNAFLTARILDGRQAVVVIDEAQNLSMEALEMLRLLSNLETDKKKLLQIWLIGQPELELALEDYRLRQLAQRINIRERLGPLTLDETKEYIFFRLTKAGAQGTLSFDPRALRALYRYARGYPRVVNIVCDRMLLAAYARRERRLGKSVVRVAVRDMKNEQRCPWWKRFF